MNSTSAGARAKVPRSILFVIAACTAIAANTASALARIQAAERQLPSSAASALTAASDSEVAPSRGSCPFSNSSCIDFAIVSGTSTTMNGPEEDWNEVESLRTKFHRDFIWFIHDGISYVILDTSVVNMAKRLYEPVERLSRQQEALGKKQQLLGQKQRKLGKKMEAIEVEVPDDLVAQVKSLELAAHNLGSTGSQTQLADLQQKIGDLQSRIGNLQSDAGRAERLIGEQQSGLGRQQSELGQQQGLLGQEQGRLASQASRKVQAILRRALSNGLAERVS